MSERAVMRTSVIGGQVYVYLHDDRIEVGRTDVMFNESLSRVAYRDARRLVTWSASRRGYLWVGAILAAIGLFGAAIPALGGRGEGAAVLWVVAIAAFVCGLFLLWLGRPGGITKLRVEGVRGDVEAILSGSRRKREKLVAEIERRVRERQAAVG